MLYRRLCFYVYTDIFIPFVTPTVTRHIQMQTSYNMLALLSRKIVQIYVIP